MITNRPRSSKHNTDTHVFALRTLCHNAACLVCSPNARNERGQMAWWQREDVGSEAARPPLQKSGRASPKCPEGAGRPRRGGEVTVLQLTRTAKERFRTSRRSVGAARPSATGTRRLMDDAARRCGSARRGT